MAFPFLMLVYALQIEKKHTVWCKNNYSNIQPLSSSWIKYYLMGYNCLYLSYSYGFFYFSQEAALVQMILIGLFVILVSPFVLNQQAPTLQEKDVFVKIEKEERRKMYRKRKKRFLFQE